MTRVNFGIAASVQQLAQCPAILTETLVAEGPRHVVFYVLCVNADHCDFVFAFSIKLMPGKLSSNALPVFVQ
jgi:hypothetical protein